MLLVMRLPWRGAILAVWAAGLVAVAGCGSTSGQTTAATTPAATPTAPGASATTAVPARRRRHRARRGSAARASVGGTTGFCPSPATVLDGVYHPDRLVVLDGCQRVTGTVEEVRAEQDGDVHYDVEVDRPYRRLLDAGNQADQHGWLVVELMPRDGGHLPEPSVGDRVALLGAWVDDTEHSWHEIHPVWSESINGGPAHRSGPQFGGSSPSDRSFDAAEDCRMPGGGRCRGYGPSAPGVIAPSAHASCAVSASYNSTYHDYDVYVHSNQPDQAVTVTDTNGDSRSWHTDGSGYADVYLRVTGDASGQRVTARVGVAVCSTGLG